MGIEDASKGIGIGVGLIGMGIGLKFLKDTTDDLRSKKSKSFSYKPPKFKKIKW